MLSTHRHDFCTTVPTEHDTLPIEQIAEFDQWIDEELAELEENFAEFVTRQSASLEWSGDHRTGR